jgi:translation initiation factor IF-3
MSKSKKVLAGHLAAAVVPHLGTQANTTEPPKAVAKTLRKLAKQVLKQQAKADKTPPAPAAPTTKRVRQALAGELTGALQPYLGLGDDEAAAPSKAVTKLIQRLSKKLVKQRHKQAKQLAKGKDKKAAAETSAEAARPSRPKPSRSAARRPAAAKPRSAAKAAPAPAATPAAAPQE